MSDTVNAKIISLSCGTLALGLAECAMMAILPEAAAGLHVSIPQAGRYISAYAAGVCVGAPLISLLTGNWPLKRILLLLACMIMAGNFATALSSSHSMMLALRFVAGLPHGAFFGMGSIVAEKLAVRGKEAQTVSTMLMGISAANVIGVPVASLLAHFFAWQLAFLFTGCWGAATLLLIYRYVPYLPPLPNQGMRGQFAFLKRPAPWLLLFVTLCANCGYFCLYSYIKPYLTTVSGIPAAMVSFVLLAAGGAMCFGTWICGRSSDRITPARTALSVLALLLVGLAGAFFLGKSPMAACLCACLVSGCVFGVGLCWQVMILQHARGGEMIGVAAIQIAFNAGNALGAWLGGIPIDWGYGAQFAAIPGIVLVFLSLGALLVFIHCYEAPLSAVRLDRKARV